MMYFVYVNGRSQLTAYEGDWGEAAEEVYQKTVAMLRAGRASCLVEFKTPFHVGSIRLKEGQTESARERFLKH
jgi:hypothetical protein